MAKCTHFSYEKMEETASVCFTSGQESQEDRPPFQAAEIKQDEIEHFPRNRCLTGSMRTHACMIAVAAALAPLGALAAGDNTPAPAAQAGADTRTALLADVDAWCRETAQLLAGVQDAAAAQSAAGRLEESLAKAISRWGELGKGQDGASRTAEGWMVLKKQLDRLDRENAYGCKPLAVAANTAGMWAMVACEYPAAAPALADHIRGIEEVVFMLKEYAATELARVQDKATADAAAGQGRAVLAETKAISTRRPAPEMSPATLLLSMLYHDRLEAMDVYIHRFVNRIPLDCHGSASLCNLLEEAGLDHFEYTPEVQVPEGVPFLVPEGYEPLDNADELGAAPRPAGVRKLHEESRGRKLDIPAPGIHIKARDSFNPGIYTMTMRLPQGARTDGTYEIRAVEYTTGRSIRTADKLTHRFRDGEPAADTRFDRVMVSPGNWGEYYGSRWRIIFTPDNAEEQPRTISEQLYLMEGWMR